MESEHSKAYRIPRYQYRYKEKQRKYKVIRNGRVIRTYWKIGVWAWA